VLLRRLLLPSRIWIWVASAAAVLLGACGRWLVALQ
jgi:hypothetical protein